MRISTLQDCLSAIVMVSWEASNGSDFYTATMQTESGLSNMCMSDSNQCSVPGLMCGYNFSVTVTASNQQCKINSTETTSLQSGKILKGHHVQLRANSSSCQPHYQYGRGFVQLKFASCSAMRSHKCLHGNRLHQQHCPGVVVSQSGCCPVHGDSTKPSKQHQLRDL